MDAKVTWKGRMSFEGSANSGFKLPLGTDPSLGGDEDGFRPIELIGNWPGGMYSDGCDLNSPEKAPGYHWF